MTKRVLDVLAEPTARNVVYLITAGGKRLRPALVLLAGATGPTPDRPALIEVSAAVELIHTATLIHDDIIDQSPVRRRQPTFHTRWGTEPAVLMGDYLYATAFTLLARVSSPQVMQVMADTCRELSRGELREVEARYRLDLTETDYVSIVRDKTASLMAACCRSGAVVGGCDADTVERLDAFGEAFGIAFQIIDDCLDLTGDPRELGKSILADLDRGAVSLPIIYLAQALSPMERRRLFAPLRTRARDAAFLRRVAAAARRVGAIARAEARARTFIEEARAVLARVPMDGVGAAYEQLTAYAIARRR